MSDLAPTSASSSSDTSCGSGPTYNGQLGLRVAAIFIIFFTSALGTLFPVISRRVKAIAVPERVYEGVKYFGSGVIISTAFIHLLAPAFEELGASCLTGVWAVYPWAPAIAMSSVFAIFIAELVAHRAGAAYLKRQGLRSHDHHYQGGNDVGHTTHGAHIEELESEESSISGEGEDQDDISPVRLGGARDEENVLETPITPSTSNTSNLSLGKKSDTAQTHVESHEHQHNHHHHEIVDEKAMSQIIGCLILEAGVIFHSMIIGLTLAVNDRFVPLFIVLIFHQMFEGLGLGSRLSVLPLPSRYFWVPYAGAILYSFITPIGISVGLGIRTSYDPQSQIANIISGVLDALAAGILLWTGLVELLAHDFIFNRAMAEEAPNSKVAFSVSCVLLGAALMALLGRWA